MTVMRAKMKLESIGRYGDPVIQENLSFRAVCPDKFDPEGLHEDNTFAKFTPNGTVLITVQNPALLGKLEQGKHYYIDFTQAD